MNQVERIQMNWTAADLQEINTALDTLKTKLFPKLISLVAADRSALPKMGEKSFSFVQKAIEYGQKNPQLIPAYLDMERFSQSFNEMENLRGIDQFIKQLDHCLDDTLLRLGAESFNDARTLYKSSKVAMDNHVPGAKSVYEDLSIRFAHTNPRKTTEESDLPKS